MRGWQTSGLALIVAAFLLIDGHLLTADIDVSPLRPVAAGEDAAPQLPSPRAERPPPALESLAEILSRPIFMPGRRPPDTAGATEAAPQAADPGIVLSGVMLSGNDRRALLKPGDGGKAEWVEEGGEFAGWSVASVAEAGITLESSGTRVALPLRPAAPAGADLVDEPVR